MTFTQSPTKGIDRYLLDASLADDAMRLHISEVEPGGRVHPPHQHGGIEAFYMMEGEATLTVGDETITLRANEALVVNPQTLHGIENRSEQLMRYLVVRTAA